VTETTETVAPEIPEGTPPVQAETETPTTEQSTEQSSVSIVEDDAEQQNQQTDEVSVDESSTEQESTEPEGAPESYEDFTTPEGVDSMGADILATYGEVAKELNLSQEQAQKMLDTVAPKIAAQHEATLTEQAQTWANEAANDPDFGGPNLKQNVAAARKAYRMGASEKLQSLLKESRMDVHPEMLKMFKFFGERVSEDKVVNEGDEADTAPGLTGDVFNAPSKTMDSFYGKQKK
tara:strand:+ start:792 stop:1496 length:705 start_codon:yes stop_codon:yes gene_type:complete